jgi:Tfp pilus assembly protein PilF
MEEKHTTWRAAQDVYRKAILLFPKDSQMLVEYGKMLAKKGGEDALYVYIDR